MHLMNGRLKRAEVPIPHDLPEMGHVGNVLSRIRESARWVMPPTDGSSLTRAATSR